MLSSPATIRRFTPPTCTLEIKATQSPLSRWTKQETVKNLQFKLSFDDPRVAEEEQITIRGDRRQLEQLYAGVIDYAQNFLQQSFHPPTSIIPSVLDTDRPYLKPQGFVKHQLYLGCLANKNSITKIQLSAVQLFDLVTALEEYNSHIIALPDLNRDRKKRILPVWGGIAAGTILVIGLTSAGIKLARERETSVASSDRAPSTVMPQLEEVKPPQASTKKETPTPKPKPTAPLSSIEKLPPPPRVDIPKPPPDIPDPAKYPLPEVAKRSGLERSNSQQTESTIAIIPELDITPEKTIAETESRTNDSNKNNITSRFSERENDSPTIIKINPEEQIQNSDRLDIALNSSIAPQSSLQQVTDYFQEKWQPPAALIQSLEYRLILNPDGTIARIIPIGKISERYLTLTDIPLQGESFIEPLTEKRSQKIRLLLNPDGSAIAFEEE